MTSGPQAVETKERRLAEWREAIRLLQEDLQRRDAAPRTRRA
jgi:hypothetical protein